MIPRARLLVDVSAHLLMVAETVGCRPTNFAPIGAARLALVPLVAFVAKIAAGPADEAYTRVLLADGGGIDPLMNILRTFAD